MRALVPYAGNQVAKPEQGGAIATPMAPAVKQAIRELIVCYTAPGESTEDRALVIQVWARETSEFAPEIVADGMHDLLRTNPRAPFRPSIKDVIDYCEKHRKAAKKRAREWYAGKSDERPAGWVDIRDELDTEMTWAVEREHYESRRKAYQTVTADEYQRWKAANGLSTKIDRWPADLLAKHGIPMGAEFRRIGDAIEAEEAERDRKWRRQQQRNAAMCAAMCRVNVTSWEWMEKTEAERDRLVADVVAQDPHKYPDLAAERKAA